MLHVFILKKLYMKVFLLLPIIIYMIVIFFNKDVLLFQQEVSFIFGKTPEVPVVALITIFFVLYILCLWFIFKFTNFFSHHKSKKLEKEVGGLKSKLLDGQGNLVKDIEKRFDKTLEKFIETSNKKTEAYKKENDKIVSNLELQIKGLKDKIDKIKRIEDKK